MDKSDCFDRIVQCVDDRRAAIDFAARTARGFAQGILAGNTRIRHLPDLRRKLMYRGMHFHDVVEVFFQLSGTSRLTFPHTEERLLPKDLLLVPPGFPHSEKPEPGNLNLVLKYLDGKLCWNMKITTEEETRTVCLEERKTDDPLFYAEALRRLTASPESEDETEIRDTGLTALVLNAARQMGQEGVASVSVLDRAFACMREHVGDPHFTLANVAEHCDRTIDHLSSLSRRKTNKSLKSHLDAMRLSQAKYLLTDPDWRVSDVAYACGFNDPLYFSRRFRKETGASPSHYRQNLVSKQ